MRISKLGIQDSARPRATTNRERCGLGTYRVTIIIVALLYDTLSPGSKQNPTLGFSGIALSRGQPTPMPQSLARGFVRPRAACARRGLKLAKRFAFTRHPKPGGRGLIPAKQVPPAPHLTFAVRLAPLRADRRRSTSYLSPDLEARSRQPGKSQWEKMTRIRNGAEGGDSLSPSSPETLKLRGEPSNSS